MVCKMLLFEYREPEEIFFEKSHPVNFDIKFFKQDLNNKNLELLNQQDLDETVAISIYKFSKITKDVLSKFKNLRVVGLRCEDYKNVDLRACLEKNIALVNVEEIKLKDNESQILHKSFKAITSVLCGSKDYRIV